MKSWAIIILLLGLVQAAYTQNYSAAAIPKPLLTRAGAVIRNSETVIEVKALDEVFYRKKYAVTILNSSAVDEATIVLSYDKNSSIKSVKGTIYNEFGLPISKISEKSFQDRSSVSDFSLYEDDRVKYFSPARVSYPFTIEYEYEIRTRQSLYFPSWVPGNSTGVAIESSSLTFICPETFNLRHKEFNYDKPVKQSTISGTTTYQWDVNNISAIREEPFSPGYEQYLVTVMLAPQQFAFRNMKGSFSNWQEFGTWMSNSLLKDKDIIPENTKDYILELTKNIPDQKEKARKIYEFMQNKTRYISVQIGIGGYQPYPAAEVDRLGYGDCKGLVNYMQSLLKVAGIESYYTVVHAGSFKRDMLADFASMQGNHIILCLPFKNDTTWLECTDKYAPFGFLGDFTDDRNVVVCTPEGGKIMRTTKFPASDNKQIRTAKFKIDEKGSLNGTINTSFTGTQYDNHHVLLNEPYAEQLKKLPELYPLPNLKILSFDFTQNKGLAPETRETISLNSGNYGSITNNKLSFPLNTINKTHPVKEVRNRVNPVCVTRGFYDEDMVSYEIPAGYKLNLAPHKKTINKIFGQYTADITMEGNTLTYTRKLTLHEGNYKAEQYQDMVDFFQAIADADSIQVFLTKL